MNDQKKTFSIEQALSALKVNLEKAKHSVQYYTKWFNQNTSKANKPWFLMLGPTKSGKTSLLESSDIPFGQVIRDEAKSNSIWIGDSALYIDLPSDFFETPTIETWLAIAKLLKRAKKNINGFILTFNLLELLEKSPEQIAQLVEKTHIIFDALTQIFSYQISLNIIFTHTDQIAGFSEFFANLSKKDRDQAVALRPKVYQNNSELYFNLESEYLSLLNRLHQKVIPLLQQNRNPDEQRLIKEFPLQIESSQSLCIHLLTQILSEKYTENFLLRGVFFSSVSQEGATLDQISNAISRNYSLQKYEPNILAKKERSYFVNKTLNEVIPNDQFFNEKQVLQIKRRNWLYTLSYPAIGLFALICIFMIGANFSHDLNALHNAQTALQVYQAMQNNPSEHQQFAKKLSPSLLSLLKAQRQINSINENFISKIVFGDLNALKSQVNTTYQLAVRNQFVPLITNEIVNALTNDNGLTTTEKYITLKTYLMLGESKKLQPEFITDWYKNLWQKDQTLSKRALKSKIALLKVMLTKPYPEIELDPRLVSKVRTQLKSLPKYFLAYLLMKDEYKNFRVSTQQDNAVFSYPGDESTIPFIYTKVGFQKLLKDGINEQSKKILMGSWVLGRKAIDDNIDSEMQNLNKQIKTLYYSDYVSWWHQYLYNTRIKSITTFKQAANLFQNLNNGTSPFLEFLNQIEKNTSPLLNSAKFSKEFNDNIASKFSNTDESIDMQQLALIKPVFKQLENIFHQLSIANNANEKAFQLAKLIFSSKQSNDPFTALFQSAEQSKGMLAKWENQLALNSWYIVLAHTKLYIGSQWRAQVLTFYNNKIANRFPLKVSAKQEIQLNDFSQFFGSDGLLVQFQNKYLSPFINTNSDNWEQEKRNGLSLQFSKNILSQLTRARIITNMFFPNEDNKIQVRFSLRSVSLEPIVNNLLLSIYGQKIFDYQGSTKISHITWPGNALRNPMVSITFNDINGQRINFTEQGVWAWFRLIKKLNLQQENDTLHYELLVDLNGSAAKFQLISHRIINPFIPGVIDQFSLPENFG